jgi:hypothetical protein
MSPTPPAPPDRAADWEAFYRDYRKPGYVPGFEITSKLGGGMFGLVFRARKQSIGKDYAIKFLQVDDADVRRAVLAELEQVKYFAQIDHPNLVSIEDRGEQDGIPYLVMSFAGTETLRDRMPKDGQPPAPALREELLRYFLQACRGLCALHERSLVHFDIKPANVFLKGPVARLGDYGLSKLVTHSRGSLSMGRGTPYYMAPEMLQRRGDHRSDVYSLGVMLYEILCGAVPFTGDSEWEVLRKHETEKPALPPHLSSLERAVLERCLQKDPAARFQSVHDLIAAFGATASVGAAAWSDVREGAGAAPPRAASPPTLPPPLPAVLPPPLPEDHVAGLTRASRDAARHAGKVASDAVRHAHRIAREAVDGARHAMGGARSRAHRRGRAAAHLRGLPDDTARQEARRIAGEVASRRRPSVLMVIGAITVGLVFLIAVIAMLLPVRSEGPYAEIASVGVEMAPPPLFRVGSVPPRYAVAVSTSTPDWVAVAQQNLAEGQEMLRQHLERMRELAPLRAEQRDGASDLPGIRVQMWEYAPEQQAQMLATLEQFVDDPAFEPILANELMQWAPGVLAVAADQLGELRFEDPEGLARARRLQQLLVYATGCRDIELVDDGMLTGRELARANRHLGTLWKWYLNEVARDSQTWQAFRSLRARR